MPCGTEAEWSRVNVIEELRRVELFAGGQPEALERLARSARIVEFVRNSHVWLEGDESRCLYLLASGQVKVYRSAPTGEDVVAAIYGPGELFGEFGLFAEQERMTSALAIDHSICIELRGEAVLDLLQRDALVLRATLRYLSRVSRRQLEQFTDLAVRNIQARLARMLLGLANLHGRPEGSGILINLRLSQTDLAGMIGASRANVNRALSTLTSNGLVGRSKRHLILLDLEGLRTAGDDE
jgi:CRP/FNR family cyclic AMP-dependent transcriptional regulator